MINELEALEKIKQVFPQIADNLHEDTIDGLIHLQISEFGRLTQSFIDNRDRDFFEIACRLFMELFDNGVPTLVNALNVSFLEHLNFQDGKRCRSWGYDAMPERMKIAFNKMEEYNNQLHRNL